MAHLLTVHADIDFLDFVKALSGFVTLNTLGFFALCSIFFTCERKEGSIEPISVWKQVFLRNYKRVHGSAHQPTL